MSLPFSYCIFIIYLRNVEFYAQVSTETGSEVAPLVDEGICVYVIRLGTKPITTSNFENDVCFFFTVCT